VPYADLKIAIVSLDRERDEDRAAPGTAPVGVSPPDTARKTAKTHAIDRWRAAIAEEIERVSGGLK
jgi:hypothetical protein